MFLDIIDKTKETLGLIVFSNFRFVVESGDVVGFHYPDEVNKAKVMCEDEPSGHASVTDADLLTFYHAANNGDIAVGSKMQWNVIPYKRLPVIAVYIA